MRTIAYTYDEEKPSNKDYVIACLTDSIDDLPMSEVATYIYPSSDTYIEARLAIRAFNTGYKFLKAYLNWRV